MKIVTLAAAIFVVLSSLAAGLRQSPLQFLSILDFVPTRYHMAIRANRIEADLAPYLRMAVAQAASVNKMLLVQCGTYPIADTVSIPSNVTIVGEGECSILKPTQLLPVYADWLALWPANPTRFVLINSDLLNGNSNIAIRSLKFDLTSVPKSNPTHAVTMYRSSAIMIDGITCVGNGTSSGDCAAMVETTHYSVQNSNASNMENACWDQWQSSSYGKILNNECWGATIGTQSYCILVTGVNTAAGVGTTHHIRLENNKCHGSRNTNIWIQGGAKGSVSEIEAIGNTLDIAQQYHNIRCSEGDRVGILTNELRNAFYQAFNSNGEKPGGGCTNILFKGNLVASPNQNGGSDLLRNTAIVLAAGSSRGAYSDNRIEGRYPYAIYLTKNANNNSFRNNSVDAGIKGVLADDGKDNVIDSASRKGAP